MIDNVKTFDCKCKGRRVLCDRCGGTGEIDWVSNIIPKRNQQYKKLQAEIEHIASNFKFSLNDEATKQRFKYNLSMYLDSLKDSLEIVNYKVDEDYNHMISAQEYTITIQPYLSNKYININLVVKK